jgi:hypothetical protein
MVPPVVSNAMPAVAGDGTRAEPSTHAPVDKGKWPLVDTEEENYISDEEGGEKVNLSPDDLNFILNRMFETRKIHAIANIWQNKKM